MNDAITIDELGKTFEVRQRAPGLGGALRTLLAPTSRQVVALEGLSLSIAHGERVAFVGPNGAGKSTTIKILSGILHPSTGHAQVAGFVPWKDRRRLAYRIGTVFGQRSQLWYHLPPADTFELLGRVYDVDATVHARRRDELVAVFDIGDTLQTPVRQLSLGQRMRCEIVASLLHAPQVLFLDEPTIGLDVAAKATIRDVVRAHAEEDGRTVLLTSHDTGDMERVCERVVVIHRGRLLLDEPIEALRTQYIRRKLVTLRTAASEIVIDLPGVRVISHRPHVTQLHVDTDRTPVQRVVQAALRDGGLHDLTVEDPPMDEVVQTIYERADAAKSQTRARTRKQTGTG